MSRPSNDPHVNVEEAKTGAIARREVGGRQDGRGRRIGSNALFRLLVRLHSTGKK